MQQGEPQEKLIVWPPVVIIENASLPGKGPGGRLTGLSNAEIRTAVETMIHHNEYRRVTALYSPRGDHLGVALLLFPDTDVGYVNALKVHNLFKEWGRGRDEWKAFKEQNPSPGGEAEEKKELYGYLANEEDMELWDGPRKTVRRWKVESFRDKVIKPQQVRAEASERAKILHEKKKRESDALEQSMQVEQSKLDSRRAELAEIERKFAAEKLRAEELKKKFDEEKAERRASLKRERDEMLKGFKEREDRIRAQLQLNKQTYQSELVEIEKQINTFQSTIEKQQKEHEKRIKLAGFYSEHSLEMRKEKRLAQLEDEKRKELQGLKEAYQHRLMRLKRQLNTEKLAMYAEQRLMKMALDEKINEAEKKNQDQNCIICLEKLEAPKQRMYYSSCGHACICEDCFPEVWRSTKDCPCCRTPQGSKPKAIPATVYF